MREQNISQCRETHVKQKLVSVVEVLLLHLGATVPAHSFIDLIDYNRHMFKALVEEVKALGFHLLKLLIAFPCCFGAGIES